MQAQRQGELKYPTSTLLKSSTDLGWPTLSADLRSHTRREGPGTPAPQAEVVIALRSGDVHVTPEAEIFAISLGAPRLRLGRHGTRL
jgi:hypothetical protein